MMDWLDHIEFWHWWVLAALLMAVEVFAPTTLFLWTGIAAAAVGLVVLVAGGIAWEIQVLLFTVLYVVSVVAWRHYRRLHPTESEAPLLNRRAEQCVGRLATLKQPIVDGRGKIDLEGATWTIQGEDLEPGARVKVVGVDGVILNIEKV